MLSAVFASPQPLAKGEGLKMLKINTLHRSPLQRRG